MAEPGRIHAVGEWWRDLSQGWRTNVTLYGLATVSLIALVVQVVVYDGGTPQRVEVSSRAPTTVPTTLRTPVGAETTTTSALAPPPPGPGTTAPAPASAPPPPSQPSGPASPPFTPTQPEDPAIPTAPPCRNSTEPRCAGFYWDPPAGDNQPLSVAVVIDPPPAVGEPVTFRVTIVDPDHAVTANCAEVDFGDGSAVDQPACNPVECAAYGPWDPPAKVTGREIFTFSHRYLPGGPYLATFTFRTDRDRCPDPYGGRGSGSRTVIQPGP